MNRLRELTAELGFIPATTDGPDIDRHRQLNKNADYWLADRPDLVAARPGVRRGHGSGVPDYRRSGGRERRGQCSSAGDAFRWHVDRGVARPVLRGWRHRHRGAVRVQGPHAFRRGFAGDRRRSAAACPGRSPSTHGGQPPELLLAGGGSQRRQSQRRANNASPILCGFTAASRVEASTPFGESALQAAFAAPGAVPGPRHAHGAV